MPTEAGQGAPLDRVARRLWGVPFALSVDITPGSGIVLAADSVALNTDREVRIDWSENVADDFSRNSSVPVAKAGLRRASTPRPVS
ncbi:MAG: hypothetical protein M3130_01125 [Actinomycetota bacterium]|nr:hypothetical protein [Actinomycetota bacterium]